MTTRAKRIRCGLDIGGTQIKAVILDEFFTLLEEFEVPSNAVVGPDSVKESISIAWQKILQQGHRPEFLGIGCAGSVDYRHGIVRNSPNFANWKDINLKDWAEDRLQIPVKLDNDANCATLAEWKLGKGRGVSNLVLLTLGTGIGGGLVIGNRLYRGSTGTGGELGHFSINSMGVECPCGNIGCFERYCSASALKLRNPSLSTKELFTRESTDPFCKQLVQEFLHHLKVGLVSLANIFDPDIILLGGGISKGLHSYHEEIRGHLSERAFPAVGKNVKIEFTQFDNNSGAIGAALLDTESQD